MKDFGGIATNGNGDPLLLKQGGGGGGGGAEEEPQNTRKALCVSILTMALSIPALIGA